MRNMSDRKWNKRNMSIMDYFQKNKKLKTQDPTEVDLPITYDNIDPPVG